MLSKNNLLEGKITRPSSHALIQGPCGDSMEFSLKITGHTIRKVRYQTSGCGASRACALETAKMAQGKSISEALLLSPGKVIKALRHVPNNHLHCAILSVSTLHKAIASYLLSGKKKIEFHKKGARR